MKKFLLFLFIGVLVSTFASAQGLTYSVTVPAGTNACYIAGDMNAWTFMEMTKVDDTHYTLTIAGSNSSQGYKYCSGPAWSYEEQYANGSWHPNRVYVENDVVEKWAAVYTPTAPKIDITIKTRSPWAQTYIYYWGDATVAWPGTLMTQNGDWWSYTVPQVTTISVIFNNGSGGTGNQTGDIMGVSANSCYVVNPDITYTTVDCVLTESITPDKPAVLVNSDKSSIKVELDGNASISVFSMQGALVKQADFQNSLIIDNLKSGLYLLKINGQSYKALVK